MRATLILIGIGILILMVSIVSTIYTIQFETIVANASEHRLERAMILAVLMCLSTVVAPLTVLPIVPIVTPILGPFITGLASYIGWGVGSIIAFWIARKYGQPLVFKIIDKETIEKTRRYVDEEISFFVCHST